MKTYIIYEIKCNDENVEFNYVGHTTNFRNRKNAHKSQCNNVNNNKYNLKIYKCIRENGNWDNWSMNPLEEYECETTMQARIREQYWLNEKQAKLNSVRAFTTLEQDRALEKITKKQFRIDNKEHVEQREKQYRIDNKESIKEYKRQYQLNNKERLNKKGVCECGANFTQINKPRHTKSPKHLELMSKLNL